jgi:hypothetical protein
MVRRFEQFIKESIDNQYIVPKTINLESDFNMLNGKLFNNELEIVPLKWFKSKKVLGLCHLEVDYIVSRFGKKRKVSEKAVGISISSFYELTYQQYLDVLAHEMIHLCIAQKGIKDDNDHGRRFYAMMDDINRRFKEFNIKQSEDADLYAVSTPNNKIKELGVLLFNIDNNDYSITVVSEKIIEDRVLLEEFTEKFKKIVPTYFPRAKTMFMTAYKCRIPALSKFKVKRALNLNLELFTLTDTLKQQIEASSKIIEKKLM